jgi:hypothetical protein
MRKLALLLLLAAVPCVFPETLKTEDLGVFVTKTNSLFASQVFDFAQLDFANRRAVDANDGSWQELKHGKGKTVCRNKYGEWGGVTEVELWWRKPLDPQHFLVVYFWSEASGSSSQSVLVQVMESRGDRVFITQQIEAEAHGAGADAHFNTATRLLTVKAVGFTRADAHCCPSFLGVVTFRWDGIQFRRVSAKKALLPKQ